MGKETDMLKQLTHTVSIAAAAALLAVTPGVGHAQSSDTQADQPEHMHGHMQGSSHMMEMGQAGSEMSCEQMQAKMQQMQEKVEQMQTELDELAAKVKSTSGAEQQQAIAKLVTTMVDQRGSMHGMMATMQPMMMGHMMRHMQSGDMGDHAAIGDMSDCSMMKVASSGDDEGGEVGEAGHSAHH